MIRHVVLTPEKVPFSYRVAGLGSRSLAWLIDGGRFEAEAPRCPLPMCSDPRGGVS